MTDQPIKELVRVFTGETEKYYVQECHLGTSYACTRAWRLCELTRAGVPDRRVSGAIVGVWVGPYGPGGTLAAYDPAREAIADGIRERVRAARASLEAAKLELCALYAEQSPAA